MLQVSSIFNVAFYNLAFQCDVFVKRVNFPLPKTGVFVVVGDKYTILVGL